MKLVKLGLPRQHDTTLYYSTTYRFSFTRNSAVADKPRDAFVQMQWHG